MKKIKGTLYHFRYLWGATLLALLVLLDWNGSSIAEWSQFFGMKPQAPLFGESRLIRSDEWAVNTPLAISQAGNPQDFFPYFSEIPRAAETDMFTVYGQPVWDISEIFRPFHWGYLFLGASRGLSFFWYARLIALFFASFEWIRILTGSKSLAAGGGLLIMFAPVVQWWFAVNGLVEMLVFGQYALVLMSQYLRHSRISVRILCAGGLVLCAGGYLLTFYPSWQIPFAFVFAACAVWVLAEGLRGFEKSVKDLAVLGIALLVFSALILRVLWKSSGSIQLVMNTVYPGMRAERGGGSFWELLLYPGNLFLGNPGYTGNASESAMFFDFFPVGILLAACVLIRKKKKDVLLICLLATQTVLILWCSFQWPEWLAKGTLLSLTTAHRAAPAAGLGNLFLLFRGASLLSQPFTRGVSAAAGTVAALGVTFGSAWVYRGSMGFPKLLVSGALIALALFCIFRKKRKPLLAFCAAAAIAGGGMVNPIQKGIQFLYDTPLAKAVLQQNAEQPGKWVVEGEPFPLPNYFLLLGVPVINCTNTYPELDRWALLDPEGAYENVYNRYAHIEIHLTGGEEPVFQLLTPDSFRVNLSADGVRSIGADYLVTRKNLSAYGGFEQLDEQSGFRIYRTVNAAANE